jgi:hypothetical protein
LSSVSSCLRSHAKASMLSLITPCLLTAVFAYLREADAVTYSRAFPRPYTTNVDASSLVPPGHAGNDPVTDRIRRPGGALDGGCAVPTAKAWTPNATARPPRHRSVPTVG